MSKFPLFFLKIDTVSAFCELTNDIPSISKSRIRNLQSIGRGLRLKDNNSAATLYDIADDVSHNGKENYTLQHFKERINIYNGEDFNYEIHNVELFNGSKKDDKSN